MTETTDLAGATTPPEPGLECADAGQFAALWNSRSPVDRASMFASVRDFADSARRCWQADHERELAHLRAALRIPRTASGRSDETRMLTDVLYGLRTLHRPCLTAPDLCAEDSQPWPCETADYLDELDGLPDQAI